MGRRYAQIVHSHPSASLAAIVGNSEPGLAQAREEFPQTPVVSGGLSGKVLDRFASVDAVVIATPEWAHERPALLALERSKHLLLEKPISDSLASARRIAAAATTRDVVAMPCHSVRFDPRVVSLRAQLIGSGTAAIRRIYGRRNADRQAYFRLSGRTDPVFWLLPHDLDLLTYLTGSKISSVSGRSITDGKGNVCGIVCDAQLANGADATLETTWITPPVSQMSKTVFMDVFSDAGVFELDLHSGGVVAFMGGEVACSTDPVYEARTSAFVTGADAGLIDHFIRVVSGLCDPLCRLEDGLRAIEAAAAVRTSIDAKSETTPVG